MAFEFWMIEEKNNLRLLLPVTPKIYEVNYGNDIQVLNATAKGNIPIAGHRRLLDITLEGFFTIKDYYFANKASYSAATSMDYVAVIKEWVNNRSTIRLVVADEQMTKLNGLFYVENIHYSEDNTSNGDINYRISLKEFMPMKVVTHKNTTNSSKQNKTRAVEALPRKAKFYTVKRGDTLTKIAREFYGDGTAWKKLYEANKKVIGKNPNLIFHGQVYVIP